MNADDRTFLLQSYGEEYGPDAGPWNTSVKSKYLEYRIAAWFEEHFVIPEGGHVCNIGIGAGSWDRYLSFRLRGGLLTSIDIDEECCRQMKLRLAFEKNPARVQVLHSDVLEVQGLDASCDLVTMIGSTRLESGLYRSILLKAFSLVKPGGQMYYQTLDREEDPAWFPDLCRSSGMLPEASLLDTACGFQAQYFQAVKALGAS